MRTSLTTIHGDSIAACACAKLLQKHKLPVSFTRAQATAGPTLLLNAATQRLIRDVFGVGENFFKTLPRIRRRIVLWGGEPRAEFPHEGFVAVPSTLLNELWKQVDSPSHDGNSAWEIHATPTIANGIQQHFGSRTAHVATVQIKKTAAETCWVESLPTGWLFLLPNNENEASLIAMGQTPNELLLQSRLVGPQIQTISHNSARFLAHPRILHPLCAPGWLACGSGAMAFDPICGEGVGNALRESILAAAVIAAHPDETLLADYSARLLLGFLRHLDTCRRFYASALQSDWWRTELAGLHRGIEWTRNQLAKLPEPQYRIVDFRLEPVG